MLTFIHSGSAGDIIASLYYCKTVLHDYHKSSADFVIIYGIQGAYAKSLMVGEHPWGSMRISRKGAEVLKRFLESVSFINSVSIVDVKSFQKDPSVEYFNLDLFRERFPNFCAGSIPKMYESIGIPLISNIDDSVKLLDIIPDKKYSGKIALAHSKRYFTNFDVASVLKNHKDELVFFGIPEEHEYMCKALNYKIEFQPTEDYYEALSYIAGTDLFISNQTGLFHAVQAILHPRILLPCPKCPNVIPNGIGAHTAYTSRHLESLIIKIKENKK